MPVSKKPRKPPNGNKFLMVSREARELRAAIGIVVYQNQQLTALLANMHERLVKLEPVPAETTDDAIKEVRA